MVARPFPHAAFVESFSAIFARRHATDVGVRPFVIGVCPRTHVMDARGGVGVGRFAGEAGLQMCTILYYTILYCTVLYYTVLHYTMLYYTTLYYTRLYY